MNTFTVVVFTFLICMTVLSTTEGRPPIRCHCPGTYSGRPIPIRRIDSLEIIPAGPHCKNVMIIATMKSKHFKNCLNPDDDWVKSLIEEMENMSSLKDKSQYVTEPNHESSSSGQRREPSPSSTDTPSHYISRHPFP